MKHWEFPIDTAEFASYQEQLSGRPLKDLERQCTWKAAKLINGAYEDGRADVDTQLYPCDPEEHWMEVAEQLHFSDSGKAAAKRFATALCRLCNTAWKRVQEDTRKAVLL